MTLLVLFHPLLRRAYERIAPPSTTTGNESAKTNSIANDGEIRLRHRLTYDFYSSLVFVVALTGFSSVKVLLILFINFKIGTSLPRNVIPVATWIFNIATLFANELAQGYRYLTIADATVPFYAAAPALGKFLDSYGGLMPRWEVLFKVTVLRMISFNFDHYWSLDRSRAGSPLEVCDLAPFVDLCCLLLPSIGIKFTDSIKKKQLDPAALSDKERASIPALPATFTSFSTYVAYILYPPLYIAGPILTFNDYISQCSYPSPSLTTRRTTLYGIRFLLTLLCMEFLQHTAYAVAISKASPDWSTYSPFQLSMLAYFNLHIIWLKLMIPWRFFRLWALVDGIDPPENMIRCMSDNYSALGFWRSWHRSYNRWLTRYVYIPLGGGPGGSIGKLRGTVNLLAVFTFVALWHDINLQLLTWGWLATFFILPEVIGNLAFPSSKWKSRPDAYRVICGIGATFNILLMMAANLVGFAVGLDGLMGLVHGIIGSWQGAMFMLGACAVLFVGVQVMFEHREGEKRRGIRLKC